MKTFIASSKFRIFLLILFGLLIAGLGALGMYLLGPQRNPAATGAGRGASPEASTGEEGTIETGLGEEFVLPKNKWEAANIRIAPARLGEFRETKWVTGKLTVNEDRLAHVYSLVEGRVHTVPVHFGQDIKAGEPLAIIDSKEVGLAKLALTRNRLTAQFAKVNSDWAEKINQNTQALIAALEKQTPITQIDSMFRDKPMGNYRQQLLTVYADLHKSRADYQRLTPLADKGIAAGKTLLAAKAVFEADQATLNGLLEQLKFTAWQQALLASQELERAHQAEAVSRSQLYILGFTDQDLKNIDPASEGEQISHFFIKAPFDGTVIAKNVVLGERVGPDTQMLELADLSTLWVQADIYQQDLPLLGHIDSTITFRSPLSPQFRQAKVFYTGDVVDPQTRTARLLALVDNPDRRLKPGMFIQVELPGESRTGVLQVPETAIQSYDKQSFVFVHLGGDQFARRDVVVGSSSAGAVEIREGLQAGESIVVQGGFAVKSEMLKELMVDED